MKEYSKVRLYDVSTLECSCGIEVSVGKVEGTNNVAIVHPKPMCDDFNNREPTSYLRWLATISKSKGIA